MAVCERRALHRLVAPVRVLSDPLLAALDGPNALSSTTIHGHPCPPVNSPRADHAALPPVIVCPGQSQGLSLPPASSLLQDGHATQAGARAAGPRWRRTPAEHMAPHGVTVLGDARSSTQPLWALVYPHRGTGLLPWQPASHATRSARVALWPANDGRTARAGRHWHGRCTAVTMGRSSNAVRLRGGDEALPGPWGREHGRQGHTGRTTLSP